MSTDVTLPPAVPRLSKRLQEQDERCYQASSILELALAQINSFDGDEEALAIVEKLSTTAYAIEGAKTVLTEVNNEIQKLVREIGDTEGASS